NLLLDIKNKLLARTDIPVISVGTSLPEFISIDNDTKADMMEITHHLVDVHGFTDIDMLTGMDFYTDSHNRVDGYKEVLLSHGIPFNEDKVIYGNFWMDSGESLAMEYISGKRRLPEAIICANDYMAYGLCDKFNENNINVPGDVTVIGYEFVGERYYHAPVLTTYFRNRQALGKKAAAELVSMIEGSESEKISLDGYMVYGNSCSCCTDNGTLYKELSRVRNENFFSQLNLVSNFEQQLTLCHSITDYICILQQNAYLIRNIKGLYLCLYENWCNSDFTNEKKTSMNNEVMVFYTVICPEEYSAEPCFFNKYELYPDAIPHTGKEFALYFCPIFFSGKEFGYFILQYDEPDGYDMVFRNWIKTATTALEILRMKNDIHSLLEYNNLSSLHDSLTGLYNKSGIKKELRQLLKETQQEEKVVVVLVRSELFSDDGSIAKQGVSVKMDTEIADILKAFSRDKNVFCAKLEDKLYALTAIGDFSSLNAEMIAEKIHINIVNNPHFIRNFTFDSVIEYGMCFETKDFIFDNAIETVNHELIKMINIISDRRRYTYYMDYLQLRCRLYQNPDTEWDSQEICRDMHLSYGHFRAKYKEIFNLSFHQDVIQSKIFYAKYLLINTDLSLPVVAEKCGYDDYKYFLRQFKNLTGVTPNTYRKG
ncbi:MAG: substrate-binding domain-containing protein, partial [Ruminococcus sp.]